MAAVADDLFKNQDYVPVSGKVDLAQLSYVVQRPFPHRKAEHSSLQARGQIHREKPLVLLETHLRETHETKTVHENRRQRHVALQDFFCGGPNDTASVVWGTLRARFVERAIPAQPH